MDVHLIDGTYELFRHFYAVPSAKDANGQEVAAVRGVLTSVLSMFERGATHLGVATDHIVESFRNDLYPGYKTSEGVPQELLSQFPILEETLGAMGVMVWPMVYFEADDALASAASNASKDGSVNQVLICTPDKDLGQCVRAQKVVCLDRRKNAIVDEDAVRARFGVGPRSVPDWLALVGDSADGFPGLSGWGRQSTSAVLAHYGHVDAIPDDIADWDPEVIRVVRSAPKLAARLATERDSAMLFRLLATLRIDRTLLNDVDELRWHGPGPGFANTCRYLRDESLAGRVAALRGS